MPDSVTWLDRARIECVVWALDQRLYDLPRASRLAIRREVRQNLLSAARDVGAGAAVKQLGGTAALASEYLTAEYGEGPRHSWIAAGLFLAGVPFVLIAILSDAALGFGHGITAADPHATGTFAWHGVSLLQTRGDVHIRQRPRHLHRRCDVAARLGAACRRDGDRRQALAHPPDPAPTAGAARHQLTPAPASGPAPSVCCCPRRASQTSTATRRRPRGGPARRSGLERAGRVPHTAVSSPCCANHRNVRRARVAPGLSPGAGQRTRAEPASPHDGQPGPLPRARSNASATVRMCTSRSVRSSRTPGEVRVPLRVMIANVS